MDANHRYFEFEPGQTVLACRIRMATEEGLPTVLMLHGLTGDEHSMWSLESVLPRAAAVIAARGPYAQQQGGYAWNPVIQAWPPLQGEFSESIDKLDILLDQLAGRFSIDRRQLLLMGFSNGAAMAFAAAMQPMSPPPLGLVAMSGHLPAGDLGPLRDTPVFWSHGLHDNFIPISVARADVARLEQLGTPVDYCEADVGHKVGAACLEGLRGWFNKFPARSKEKPE